MPTSPQSLSDLQSKCGLPPADCRAALEQHAGDVDAALASLIDAGKVTPDQLNPDTVSDELFDRAAKLQKLNLYRSMTDPAGPAGIFGNLLGNFGALLGKDADGKGNELTAIFQKALGEQFGNKTPEEMMAEDEARESDRLKEFGIKPMPAAQQARISAKVKRRSEYLKSHPVTLDLPPFPPLKLEMHEWTGQGTLKAFAGSQQRHGGYTSLSYDEPSDGSFSLNIPRLDEDDANPKPPAPEQLSAYAYLIDNQDAVVEAILKALLKDYTKLRKSWLKNQPELEGELPLITTPAEMKKNIGLGTLHMHDLTKAGHAYLGLELGCTWDEEHGAGVLLHKNRILAIGQADTSFNPHPALADGATPLKPT